MLPDEVIQKSRNQWVDLCIAFVREKHLATFGAGLLIFVVFLAVFADVLTPYDMDGMSLREQLQGPSWKHPFGTDELGRDSLTRVIYGARTSIIVGVAGSVFATILSTGIGLFSGYAGRWFDGITQRFVDSWMAFPDLFLDLAILAVLGPGLLNIIIVIGLLYAISGSRIIRGSVLSAKENDYVQAARALGASPARIMFFHILPNVMAPVIILLTTRMASMILAEASLSFLGYGIPPPQPSWGGLLSGAGKEYMLLNPWMALWPGLFLSIVVYGINMFGDGVRDVLDPRLRGSAQRYS